uniref:Uncharacterized protein n=1 Tax=Populus trichocarpa TaxID=3694 RepID=A9PHR3_POPTR|nr:unknown [Populus trichocarpa]
MARRTVKMKRKNIMMMMMIMMMKKNILTMKNTMLRHITKMQKLRIRLPFPCFTGSRFDQKCAWMISCFGCFCKVLYNGCGQ